jgi:hypothetical protein
MGGGGAGGAAAEGVGAEGGAEGEEARIWEESVDEREECCECAGDRLLSIAVCTIGARLEEE